MSSLLNYSQRNKFHLWLVFVEAWREFPILIIQSKNSTSTPKVRWEYRWISLSRTRLSRTPCYLEHGYLELPAISNSNPFPCPSFSVIYYRLSLPLSVRDSEIQLYFTFVFVFLLRQKLWSSSVYLASVTLYVLLYRDWQWSHKVVRFDLNMSAGMTLCIEDVLLECGMC